MSKLTPEFETSLSDWREYATDYGPAKAASLIAERAGMVRKEKLVRAAAGVVFAASVYFTPNATWKVVEGLAATAAFALANKSRRLQNNFLVMQKMPEFMASPPPVAPYKVERPEPLRHGS